MRLGILTGAVEGPGPSAHLHTAEVRTSRTRTSAVSGAAGTGERARSAFAPQRNALTPLSPMFVEREGIRPSDGCPRQESRRFSGHE